MKKGVNRQARRQYGMGKVRCDEGIHSLERLLLSLDIPFPFDHFFFCFLPADAAAGAYKSHQQEVKQGAQPKD